MDADVPGDDGFGVVQLTPPGSPASIIFGNGVTAGTPGSTQGIYLVVDDIGPRIPRGSRLGRHIGSLDRNQTSYASFASFSDPDGNGWVLQEITERLPGR